MMDNIKITQVQTGCNNQSQIIKCYVDKINGLQCEKVLYGWRYYEMCKI